MSTELNSQVAWKLKTDNSDSLIRNSLQTFKEGMQTTWCQWRNRFQTYLYTRILKLSWLTCLWISVTHWLLMEAGETIRVAPETTGSCVQ